MSDLNNYRVVPKNLLVSAMVANPDDSKALNGIRESHVRDLCTLINLAVLYDGLETLGFEGEQKQDHKPDIAPYYKSISTHTGLKIKLGPSNSSFDQTIAESAATASYVFAKKNRTIDPELLRGLLSAALQHSTSDSPDYWSDFNEGSKLLEASSVEVKFSESQNFWLRTFLYSGLAAVRGVPFVPDAVRAWGRMPSVTKAPYDYSKQLETVVRAKYKDASIQNLILDAPFAIPPFAATVFLRTKGDRSKIWDEVNDLREQLSKVRTALSLLTIEKNTADYSGLISIFGAPATIDSKSELDSKIREALGSLEEMKFALPPQLMILKPMYDFANSVRSILANPIVSSFALAKVVKDAATAGKDLISWNDEHMFAEVHHQCGWTLREWQNQGIKLDQLFGTIKDDEPLGKKS